MNDSIEDSLLEYWSRASSEKNKTARERTTLQFIDYLENEEQEHSSLIQSPSDIHEGYINRWISNQQEKNYSDSTIYSRVWLLLGWLRHIDDDRIKFEQLDGPNRRVEASYLSHNAFSVLVNSEIYGKRHTERNRFMIMWGYYIGTRTSETVNIEVQDIDLDDRYVEVDTLKGGEDRKVYFSRYFKRQLKKYLNDIRTQYKYADKSPYLFVSEQSEQLSSTRINAIVRETAKNANLQKSYTDAAGNERHFVVWTTLRDSFAVNRLLNGQDLYSLSKAMGHSTTEMTEHYLSVTDQERKEQAENYSPSRVKSNSDLISEEVR